MRDFAEVRAGGTDHRRGCREALAREGVDELGLDRLDRAFLRTIVEQYGGGPVGIGAIAATLTEDAETLEDVVEPYLLKTRLRDANRIRTARDPGRLPASWASRRAATMQERLL